MCPPWSLLAITQLTKKAPKKPRSFRSRAVNPESKSIAVVVMMVMVPAIVMMVVMMATNNDDLRHLHIGLRGS